MNDIGSGSGRDPVDQLLESFLERLRRGERPSLEEYAARCPERAVEIRELSPALIEMEQLKPAVASETGPHERPTARPGSMPRAAPAHPERLGEYRILRVIGEGGMGVVYEAEHESLSNRVALKVMHPHFRADGAHLRRFRQEARSAARLHHTNIVPVFAFGEQDGICYHAMQHIAGVGLNQVLDDVRRLREECRGADPAATVDRRHDRATDRIEETASIAALGLLTGQFATAPPTPTSTDLPTTRLDPGQASRMAPVGVDGPAAPVSKVEAPADGSGSSFARQMESVYFLLAIGNEDGRLFIRDVKRGTLASVLHEDMWGADRCLFAPGGSLLLTGSFAGSAQVWDASTGRLLVTASPGRDARFSTDGRRLAIHDGSNLDLWEVAHEQELITLNPSLIGNRTPLEGRQVAIQAARFSPDGLLVALATDKDIHLYDGRGGRELAELESGPGVGMMALFDRDGRNLLTYSKWGLFRWPIRDDPDVGPGALQIGPPVLLRESTSGSRHRASWLLDGRTMALNDHDNSRVLLVDTAASHPARRHAGVLATPGRSRKISIAISPDGRWAASGSWNEKGGLCLGPAASTVRAHPAARRHPSGRPHVRRLQPGRALARGQLVGRGRIGLLFLGGRHLAARALHPPSGLGRMGRAGLLARRSPARPERRSEPGPALRDGDRPDDRAPPVPSRLVPLSAARVPNGPPPGW